mmetsp:Transcript_1544/g.2895  ORF Transcript_1544/g.2895 Transcript_1544/m.2895 type:complete len:91 (-) Transcript_1544:958-1230(-)
MKLSRIFPVSQSLFTIRTHNQHLGNTQSHIPTRSISQASYSHYSVKSCSFKIGVKYSATFSVSTATSIVATPSASPPSTTAFATLCFKAK